MSNKNLFLQSPDAGDIEEIFSKGAAALAAKGLPSPTTQTAAQPSNPAPRASGGGDVQSFVKQYQPLAERIGASLGVSPESLLGQWGLETGWGKSVIPGTNNLGNIKDFSGKGPQATDNMTGSRDAYRAYGSADEFGDDFGNLLVRRYRSALGSGKDPRKFFAELKKGGYAEDPEYVTKGTRAAQMAAQAMGQPAQGGTTSLQQQLDQEEAGRYQVLTPEEAQALERKQAQSALDAEEPGRYEVLTQEEADKREGKVKYRMPGEQAAKVAEGIKERYKALPKINEEIGKSIKDDGAALEREFAKLEAERSSIKTEQQVADFNKRVDAINKKAEQYKERATSYQKQVDSYNTQLGALKKEEEALLADQKLPLKPNTFGENASDVARMGIGALNKGVGHVVGGVGEGVRIVGEYTTTALINKVFGTDYRTGNVLQPIADFYKNAGERAQGSISEESKLAIKNSTPDGDLFKPSTWSFGENPSARGILLLTTDVLGSMAPVVAASIVSGGSAGVGAAVGAAQSGGAGADQARQTIREMAQKGTLEKESAYYRELLASGKSKEEAQAITEDAAANLAAPMAAVIGGVGGAATSKIVNPATNIVGGAPLAGRIAGRAGLGAVEEGAQEVGEGVAAKQGTNMGAGTNVDITEGSFGDAVLGAIGGGTVGAGAGAMSKRQTSAQAPSGPIGRAINKASPEQPAADQVAPAQEQAAAPSADVADMPRVKITAENGTTITGFAEQLNEDGTGRVLGDDGQVYVVGKDDGATIALEEQVAATESEAASAEQTEQAAAKDSEIVSEQAQTATEIETPEVVQAAQPEAQPVEEVKKQAEPEVSQKPLTEWTEEELRERLKYVAQQSKVNGWDGRLLKERARVSKEINRRNMEESRANSESEVRSNDGDASNAAPAQIAADDAAGKAPAEVVLDGSGVGNGEQRATDAGDGRSDSQSVAADVVAKQPDAALTYDQAKARADAARARSKVASDAMAKFPKGAMGLTPDATKATPEWQQAKRESDAAFKEEQAANTVISKKFAKEAKADRDARRQAQAKAPEAAPVESDAHAGKWFGSTDKAEAYIAKKKIADTHEVVKTGKVRFEVKPKAAKPSAKEKLADYAKAKADAEVLAKDAPREIVAPAGDALLGQNEAGNDVYAREDGSRYVMRGGRPVFGGDLAVASDVQAAATDADLDAMFDDAVAAKKQADAKAVPAQEASKEGEFDSEAWDKARADVIAKSREAGNTHLDKVPAYVETMRGKRVFYVHDPKVHGTIRTVDNRGNVHIDWADAYSAEKEMASPSFEGKKKVFRTTIGRTDLKDYAIGKDARQEQPDAQATPKTITEKLKDSIKQQGEAATTKPAAKKPSKVVPSAESSLGISREEFVSLHKSKSAKNKAAAEYDFAASAAIEAGTLSADAAEANGVSKDITWPAHRRWVYSQAPKMTLDEFRRALAGRHGMAGAEVDAYFKSSGGNINKKAVTSKNESSNIERDPKNGYAKVKVGRSQHFVTPYEDHFVIRNKNGEILRGDDRRAIRFQTELDAIAYAASANKTEAAKAAESLASAAKNTAAGLTAAIDGLGELFGGTGKFNSGLAFDEETYAKAKPLFKQAIANLGDAGRDLKAAMQAVVNMVMDKFGEETTQRMKPYVVRFVKDVRDGTVDVAAASEPTAAPSAQELSKQFAKAKEGQMALKIEPAVMPDGADGLRFHAVDAKGEKIGKTQLVRATGDVAALMDRFAQDVAATNARMNQPKTPRSEVVKGKQDATGASGNLERSSQKPATEPVLAQGDGDASGAVRPSDSDGGRTGREADQGQQGDSGVSTDRAPTHGDGSFVGVRRGDGAAEFATVATGAEFGERGSDAGNQRVQPDASATEAARAIADSPAKQRDRRLEQRKAESVKSAPGIDNIRETLPSLLPGQQEDVAKTEARFAKPEGYGMLLTNGTGTGKTYSGLGTAKRFDRDGKKNILVVVPDEKVASDWINSAKDLLLDASMLPDTKSAGEGMVVTTYANLGQNPALASRDWDLVIADEAHKLMQGKDGKATAALDNLRAITLHPDGSHARYRMQNAADLEKLEKWIKKQEALKADGKPDEALQSKIAELNKSLEERRKATAADVMARQGAARTRMLALSATPFAYEKSVDWAQGYLFEYPKKEGSGYNSGNGQQRFMMQHFGYTMRYNKLTEPDAKVDRGLMQRNFNTWLKREGALSGRVLDVDQDYDRRFVLIDSKVGNRIDEAFKWLDEQARANNSQHGRVWSELRTGLNNAFDYLTRRYLLEAIKAKESIPYVKGQMELGRKVVVFHDYKKGGGTNPFAKFSQIQAPATLSMEETKAFGEALSKFNTTFKDLVQADWGTYGSAVEAYREAFGDGVLVVNGDEKSRDNLNRYKKFQDDASGPQVLLVQSAKNAGWSGHDTTGKHQRVLLNLGLPTAPIMAIQQEGRIYRTGQASNAIMRYMNTGTSWEKTAFAATIAGRASTAENLGMGEDARALKDSFVSAFEESDAYPPGHEGEGTGGKERDRVANAALSEYDRAKAYYWATQKKNSRTKAQEGVDYFATPEPLGQKMVQWTDARGGDKVLEPSAGHGAIARWFGENVERTVVEPSTELRSRLSLVIDPANDRIVAADFEDLAISNKYDAIAMNPPFGTAGRTAIDHLTKAAGHLRERGRVVAIIPTGPAADKKFDAWLYAQDDKGQSMHGNLHLVADIKLPQSAFERAGTNVAARVVVIDKISDPEATIAPTKNIDFSGAKDINEFFDRLENIELPVRAVVAQEETAQAPSAGKAVEPTTSVQEGDKQVEHVTGKGKTIRGIVRQGITLAEAREIDPYTFKKDGGYFIREKYLGEQPKFSVTESRVETPEFKRWFGDSKVVDAQGKPLVVYHATPNDFTEFKAGGDDVSKSGHAMWFGVDAQKPEAAHNVLKNRRTGEFKDGVRTMPVYLKVRRPLVIDDQTREWARSVWGGMFPQAISKEVADDLKKDYDGVIYHSPTTGKITEYIVFEPTQIKSAIGNNGQFDPANPDIRYSAAPDFGPVAEEFRDSPAAAIEHLKRQQSGEAVVKHPTLGDISLVWGDGNMGLSHVIARHGEKMLGKIPALLRDGEIYTKPNQPDRFFIGNDTHEAAIRMDFNGSDKAWLVSAYEKHGEPRASAQAAPRSTGKLTTETLRAEITGGVLGKVVDQMIERGEVVLHADANTLPARAKGVRGVQAVVMPDGKIHMVANAITKGNAQGVLLHEMFHRGGKSAVGGEKAWGELMGDLGSLFRQANMTDGKLNKVLQAAAARVNSARARGGVSTAMTVEEFGAYAIEEYSRAPESLPAALRKWVEDIIGFVKAYVRKQWGKQLGELTPAQVTAVAKMALLNRAADLAREGRFSTAQDQTQTEAFKRWFGDSKAVDAKGNPLVVYHGSPDVRGIIKGGFKPSVSRGDVYFFTDSQKVANTYADPKRAWDYQNAEDHVIPLYLSMQNPMMIDAEGKKWRETEKHVSEAKEKGHDGIIIKNSRDEYNNTTNGGEASTVFAVFNPTQVKSAAMPGMLKSRFDGRPIADISNNGDFDPSNPDIRYSLSEEESAKVMREAAAEFDVPRNERIGSIDADISFGARKLIYPRTVASLHKEFTPVYETGVSQQEARDAHITDLGAGMNNYNKLSAEQKLNVNKVLELGRLTANTYTADQLRDGVVNEGVKKIVRATGGKPQVVKEEIHAELTGAGEVVELSPAEIKAYEDLRAMFDKALDKFRDQTLIEFGHADLAGQPDAAKALDDMAKTSMGAEKERLQNVASFIRDIEQAKRTGYVPFTRYGDYYVTVKEQVAELTFVKDGDDAYMVSGITPEMEADVIALGGLPEGDAYIIPAKQKQAVQRLAEKTVYSTKVETSIADMKAIHLAKKNKGSIESIPSVKAAIDKARAEWVGNNPKRRLIANPVIDVQSEQKVDMAAVDALAQMAQLDNANWDEIRAQLATAMQARSFRKHFFNSDNIPGYSGDFERSMADYVIGMSGYLSRRAHIKEWENGIDAIKRKPELRKYAERYRDYVNSPQEEFAAMRQAGFGMYIAGVPATAFANMTQVPLLTVPVLSQVAPAALVMKEIARAYKDAFAMVSRKNGLDMFDPNKAPADVREIVKNGWADGSFVPLESFDMMMTARQRNVGRRKLVKGFNDAVKVAALFFSFAERLNRLVTFMAAARLSEKPAVRKNAEARLGKNALMKQTVLGENWNAENFAKWAVDETQYRMGKSNRPEISRGVGAAIMQFKGFMMQTLEVWYRMATQHGKQGKLAMAASLLALYTFSGLWGLPGADDLRKITEQAYRAITDKDLDIKTELRAFVARTTGSNVIAQATTKGLSYPLGVDLTRVGMGTIFPDSAMSAAGIPVDMLIGRPTRAFGKAGAGDYAGAAGELMPNFAKNWAISGGWAADGVRDKSGQRILAPEQLSTSDLVMKSLGFQPSIVTDVRDYEYAQRRQETSVDGLKRKWTAEIARTNVAIERAEEAGDVKRIAKLNERLDEIYAAKDAHNEKASPEEQIEIGNQAVRNRMARERGGVMQTWGKERKQAREGAGNLRDLFGLQQEE